MRKYWKWITAILAVLLVGLLIWFLIDYYSIPRLPDSEKKKIEELYYDTWYGGPKYSKFHPLTWYDENGGIEEDLVWRYIGTYGDCYAFLKIGDNENDLDVLPPFNQLSLPVLIQGLSRDVYYPIEADVILYHTQKEITYKLEYSDRVSTTRMDSLSQINYIGNRKEWLTDAQLEQLTRDIEKIAKAHN